jgi:tetratricopeptide (TPR) repeat protein
MFNKSLNLLFALLLILITFGFAQEEKKIIPITTKSKEALEYYQIAVQASHHVYSKEAMENFQKAIELDPGFVLARAQYSVYLSSPQNQQMIDKAKKYFPKVTKGERKLTMAIEAFINNNRTKEREILKELSAEYPQDAVVFLRLQLSFYLDKFYDESIKAGNKALECDPEIYRAYNLLGYGYLQVGKFDESIRWFKKYAELKPDNANPWDSLGDAYKNAGRYKEAWECYQKALKIKPNFTASFIHQGDIKHELGYYEEAIPYYEKGLRSLLSEREISESHYRAADAFWRLRLAYNYLSMDEIDKAEKEINITLQHNFSRGNVCAHYLAAQLALKRGLMQKAKEEAALVQKLINEYNFLNQEKNQIVHFLKSKIAFAEGDLNSSEKYALLALKCFNEEWYTNMLSWIYPMGNDDNTCMEPLNLLAKIYRKKNRFEEEIQTIKKSLQILPQQPELHFRLGEIYTQQDKEWDAERAYIEFLTLCDDFKCGEELKKGAELYIINTIGYKFISSEELLDKIEKKEKMVLIDCRPVHEYRAGHIPGAINFPMKIVAFSKDIVIKTEMEKNIEESAKITHLLLADMITAETYMPQTAISELIKYLPEERDAKVIFYCRKPI